MLTVALPSASVSWYHCHHAVSSMVSLAYPANMSACTAVPTAMGVALPFVPPGRTGETAAVYVAWNV